MKNINMNKKGFTLIELLVVIAIIGILAGLIIVSLNDATLSAKDAKIKSAMDQLRVQAAIFKTSNGSYEGVLADPKIDQIEADIAAEGGTLAWGDSSKTAWCAWTTLPGGGYICMDSTGDVNTVSSGTGACTDNTCD